MKKVSNKDEDIALVHRAQKGDYRAFDLLILKYQVRVTTLANKFVNDKQIAEDIAQESFIKVYKSIGSFRGESAFFTWLYRVAVNTAKNYLSSKKRKKEMLVSDITDSDTTDPLSALTTESPEDILAANNLREIILKSFGDLPEEIRTALSLREFEGLSYQEIGKILDCPVGTVRSRIFRGREQIQEAIDHLLPSSIHAGNERRKKE
ncbi:MAG: sigma-70 family RNA polymerase sigma factor [Pseudomonadota bacterium]|nr:sigma-70 family RNA polymerase sigma factor [Pseudomonadota bacterium]